MHQGSKNDDFTLDIDDSNIEQNSENQCLNQNNVSLILSDLIPVIKPANNLVISDDVNDGEIQHAMEDGDGETNGSVPQQRNGPNIEPKSKKSGILHLLRSKFGGVQVEPVGPDGPKEPEEQDEPQVDVQVQVEPVGPDKPREQNEPEVRFDKDKQQMEWKILLKTISTHQNSNHVQGKLDEFLSSNKMKWLG